MREILFRGKQTGNGEWYEGADVMHQTIRGELCLANVGEDWVSVDPSTFGQYTGLTDKNDRKIFEGDIVKYSTNKIGIINYGTACFCTQDIKSRNNPAVDIVFSESPNGVEIIGNIYDNPELLEVHKHE